MTNTRQELVEFFHWPPDKVNKLNIFELEAWTKHITALKEIGFWPIPPTPIFVRGNETIDRLVADPLITEYIED